MRIFLKCLLVLTLLCNITGAYSEGILIFEISDAQNKPVMDLSVEVKKDGVLYKTYTTDESGRVVDLSIPSGKYSYSFNYGDLGTDTFSVKDADYTWINLDYRKWIISFKDEDGKPIADKRAAIFKVETDLSEHLVAEKFSNASGMVEFLVPEGNYKYETFRGTNYVTVKDENINTALAMTGGETTHETYFCFVKDKTTKEPVAIYAKDVEVTHIAPDSVYLFGSADANSESVAYGYVKYSKTATCVSCTPGTYTCKVATKEYSTIIDTFEVDDNTPIKDNVVYLVLPKLPGDSTNRGDDPDKNKRPGSDTITIENPYHLDIFVISAIDSVTPIEDAEVKLYASRNYSISSRGLTDEKGYSGWYVAEGSYDVNVYNASERYFHVTSDTVLYMYVDPLKMPKVYFEFYYDGERFNPASVNEIIVSSWYDYEFEKRVLGTHDEETNTYIYDKPLLLSEGSYMASFYIDEKDYSERAYYSFDVNPEDTVVIVKAEYDPIYNVKIILKDINGNVFESRQYIDMGARRLVTDSLGCYSGKMLKGNYTFSAFDEVQNVELVSDTTLYFQSKAEHAKHVNFQFLHDGKMVYPQIMNMDIKTLDNRSYSKAISHFHSEYKGNTNVWVFDEPTLCEANDYYVEYELKDYEYNGKFQTNFNVSASASEDTTIYIVVPVKRSVNITVMDANHGLVKGVFGNIYKYDSTGVLMDDLKYDNANHQLIRTNAGGVIIDHLVPGRYQLRIIDMKRDFIVKDYDLELEVINNVPMYDVKYYVQYQSTKAPVKGILLDVNKENVVYNNNYTDENGLVEFFAEAGDYNYQLHYGEGHSASYKMTKDTTIYIYVEDPVLIDSMHILGCACMSHNDTTPVSVFYSPANATLREFDWVVDNEIMAHVTSDGKLVTNDIETDGFVTVTAISKDGSGVKTSKKFYVGNGNCGAALMLNFADTKDKDMPLMTDSVALKATFSAADEFSHSFIYQFSTDSVHWTNLYGPTNQAEVSLPADTFKQDALIRVLSGAEEADVVNFAKTGTPSCGSDKMSDTLSLRINHLTPVNWPDSICASIKEITLSVSTEELGSLAEGYTIVWYQRPASVDTFQKLDKDGQTTIQVTLDSTTAYKAAVQKGDFISAYVQQNVFVEQLLDFHIAVDHDTICLGDTLHLAAVVTAGEAGAYAWWNGSEKDSAVTLAADQYYAVKVTPKYNICPSKSDSVKVTIDTPVDFNLNIDRTIMCVTDAEGVQMKIDTLSAALGKVVWSDASNGGSLHAVPTATTTYSAAVSSLFEKCPTITKDVTVKVNESLGVTLKSDTLTLCQTGNDTIRLTAQVISGEVKEFVWWNGQRTRENTMALMPQASVTPWVVVVDSICPNYKDSVVITVDQPIDFSLSIDRTNLCVTDSDGIHIKIDTISAKLGKVVWSDSTNGATFHAVPQSSTTYSATAASPLNLCPSMTKSVAVKVNETLAVSLNGDVVDICQYGNDTITLTAETISGEAKDYIWWNGQRTQQNIMKFVPQENVTPWVAIADGICADSDKDSIDIRVAKPSSVTISSTNKVFEYRSDINLVATTSSFVYGPYSWYSVEADGGEYKLNTTDEPNTSDLPTGDISYYVLVENGECPVIVSDMIKMHLVDNIVIPTIFTPYVADGQNDDFMPGYPVIIYDRYGNIVCNSDNGWDGNYRGKLADPGVYYYVLTLKDERVVKGTIELFRK